MQMRPQDPSRLRQGCQSPKVAVFLGAEARAHEWEELELLLFRAAVTRCTRQPPSPLTPLHLCLSVCLPGLHELSLQKH